MTLQNYYNMYNKKIESKVYALTRKGIKNERYFYITIVSFRKKEEGKNYEKAV